MELVREIQQLAARKGCTASQISLAWVRAHSEKNGLPAIIPIPGATTKERVMENTKRVNLDPKDLEEIDQMMRRITIEGDRYGGLAATLMDD